MTPEKTNPWPKRPEYMVQCLNQPMIGPIPCPYCGENRENRIIKRSLRGTWVIDHLDGTFRIQSCESYETKEAAIKAWNDLFRTKEGR